MTASSARLFVFAVVCVGRASVADSPPAIATATVTAEELPRGVTARGDLQSALKFADANGTNYVLFSSKSSSKPSGEQGTSRSTTLYVEDWVVPKKGAPRNLLPVRDMVVDCVMGDVTAKFHDAAVTVTDLDRDGIAEVTFGYELACRSDVSPATYKLLLLENGTKYILRGQTRIHDGDGPAGGTFAADPAEAKWPAAFLAHAKELWAKTSNDLELLH